MSSPHPAARALALRLLWLEIRSGEDVAECEAARRVLGGLRAHLVAIAGIAGHRALVTRAHALARRESAWLDGITIGLDGDFQGLEEAGRTLQPGVRTSGVAGLVAHLLGLLMAFVGEELTQRLVMKTWPDARIDAIPGDEREIAE